MEGLDYRGKMVCLEVEVNQVKVVVPHLVYFPLLDSDLSVCLEDMDCPRGAESGGEPAAEGSSSRQQSLTDISKFIKALLIKVLLTHCEL